VCQTDSSPGGTLNALLRGGVQVSFFRHRFRSLQWANISRLEAHLMKSTATLLFAGVLMLAATQLIAQQSTPVGATGAVQGTQIIALDECDPTTFNEAPILKPDFCHSVAAGGATTLDELFGSVAQGHPDPGWDFEPDILTVKQGTDLSVVNQGGEPHTFTEVKEFGGGFIDGLNSAGEQVAPECSGGFKNLAVARTRIVQGSTVHVSNLSKGTHKFQCCIHPWMHFTVNVR
jgi:plastocyanin